MTKAQMIEKYNNMYNRCNKLLAQLAEEGSLRALYELRLKQLGESDDTIDDYKSTAKAAASQHNALMGY